MPGRVLDVTAHTTLDYVDTTVRGPDWTDEGAGVLDVRTPKDDPDGVVVELELDPTAAEHVDPHADSVRLTAEQARDLADALIAEADAEESDRPRRLGG
jgi:hypothetical protein